MIKLYEIDGFIIYVIMIEMGFDKVAEIMGNGEVNISEAREHVLEVKKMIGTVKDCGGGDHQYTSILLPTITDYHSPAIFYFNMVEFTSVWERNISEAPSKVNSDRMTS